MTDSYKIKLGFLDNPVLSLEIIDFICGEHIGSGCYREVFEYTMDKNYVVKVENSYGEGENWSEWRIWSALHKTEHAKWFAPCTWISDNGLVMLQRKTKDLYSKEKFIPDKIPAYFTDIKSDNFGWIGRQLVCHDYSHCLEMFSGNYGLTKKMQKVKF